MTGKVLAERLRKTLSAFKTLIEINPTSLDERQRNYLAASLDVMLDAKNWRHKEVPTIGSFTTLLAVLSEFPKRNFQRLSTGDDGSFIVTYIDPPSTLSLECWYDGGVKWTMWRGVGPLHEGLVRVRDLRVAMTEYGAGQWFGAGSAYSPDT
jgi:hypothetical protein